MNKWSAVTLSESCSGELIQVSDRMISGFSIDSRTISCDEIYIAIIGENLDGHRFVESSIKAGAAAILISQTPIYDIPQDVSVIKVDDTLSALQQIAAWQRQRLVSKVIGVTGSNGKTTTRSMLHHLLSRITTCGATDGNFNNHIGLPMTLMKLNPDNDYAVLEMGMNHLGEIRNLCNIARPDAVIISNIGPAHIGILGSQKNIALAKSEILEQLQPGHIAVVTGDSNFTELFKEHCQTKIITFGKKSENDYQIKDIVMTVDSLSFKIKTFDEEVVCELSLAGAHNASNATAALAMFNQLGHSLRDGCEILKTFKTPSARMEKIVVASINILLDCYNANPDSMREALNFLAVCEGNKVAVLGDMRELGNMSIDLHRELGFYVVDCNLNLLVCVGDDARHIAAAAIEKGMSESLVIALNSNKETAELLRDRLINGSTVLFKASRSMHFETIVQELWPTLGKELH